VRRLNHSSNVSSPRNTEPKTLLFAILLLFKAPLAKNDEFCYPLYLDHYSSVTMVSDGTTRGGLSFCNRRFLAASYVKGLQQPRGWGSR